MLFEVPGLNLGVPKTEDAKKQDSKSSNINIIKDAKKKNLEKNISDNAAHLNPNNKSSGNALAGRSALPAEATHSKSTSYKSISKKTEKESGKSKLQQKMEEKLRGARFRYLNQKLYQSNSREALDHFKEHPEDFQKVPIYFLIFFNFLILVS